jgi:hypothetical protein
MSITVSDWFYEGVVIEGGILSIDPTYFCITGVRERWLYRVARKHAGGHGAEGFAISLPTFSYAGRPLPWAGDRGDGRGRDWAARGGMQHVLRPNA